ncbi:MAG: hypothetical protein CMH49_07415 [Myxococcales bacterium]|nr:hypothetical protein [Myxococcales bacterium]
MNLILQHKLAAKKTALTALLFGLSSSFILSSCDKEKSDSVEEQVEVNVDETGRTQFLRSIRSQIVLPLLNGFEPKLSQLNQMIEAQDLEQSQQAWREAMLHWQQIELIQFGPAGVSGLRVGGQDLRDQIYAFPLTNPCRVDQVLVDGGFAESDWLSQAQINVSGLDAIEHLLFRTGSDSACPAQTKIVRDGDWAAFQNDESNANTQRWAYLKVLGAGVKTHYDTMVSAWNGSFGQAFEDAQAPFTSQKEAIDQVFAGIFYIDEVVKDLKLGAPVGIYMTCIEERCPELVEHQGSKLSKEVMIANLQALRAVFKGSSSAEPDSDDGFGFTDLLVEEGASELGEQLESLIDRNIERAEALSGSFNELLENSPEELENLHSSVKELCDLMKSQMVTVLNLSVPQEGAGDND